MEYSENPLRKEHAYHRSERREARRKLAKIAVKSALAGAAALGIFSAEKAIEQAGQDSFKPDSYYSGKVEISMNPNLNLRETPVVITNKNEEPNTVNWKNVEEINGVKVQGETDFIIENPLITKGDNPEGGGEKGKWITLDAKVDQLLGEPKEEKLYISFSPQTREFVKPIQSGNFVKISDVTSTDTLGIVSLKTAP